MSGGVYSGKLGVENTNGLQTAWLLATLGSKMNKKNIKKEILQICIPQVCNELLQVSREKNIRYSSNLLYGISLMYKSQMNYFMNDISLVKTRLRKDFLLRNFDSYNTDEMLTTIKIDMNSGKNSYNPNIFLENDPAFNIEIDLFPLLDLTQDEPLRKQRKLQIHNYDQKLFPELQASLETYTISQQHDILFDKHFQTIDDFLNKDLQQFDDSISDVEKSFRTRERELNRYAGSNKLESADHSLDFQFNNEGIIIEDDVNNMEIDEGMIELINFNNQPMVTHELDSIEDRVIENDKDFQLHTDTNQAVKNSNLVLIHPSKETQNKFFRIIIDDPIRIPSIELIKQMNSYKDLMLYSKNINSKNAINNFVKDVLGELYFGLNQYTANAYISILGDYFSKEKYDLNTSVSTDLNTILKELESITRLQNNIDDYEIGRDVQKGNVLDDSDSNANEFDFLQDEVRIADEDFELHELNDSRDVFGLSFNGLDGDTSLSNQTCESGVGIDERDYLQEESVRQVLGATTNSDMDASRVNYQLVKFFNFLHERSNLIGESVSLSHLHLSKLNEENQLGASSTSSQPVNYRRILFSKLIPNYLQAVELNEEPINKKLVASSFSSLLALATKNLVHISTERQGDYELLSGNKLCVILLEKFHA